MSRHARVLVGMAVAAVLTAACGSGESILDAGLPEQDTVPVNTGTGVDATAAPTTTTPLDEYPACPADALEQRAAGEPVEVTLWYALGDEADAAMNDLVNTFNRSQDDVRVRLQHQGGYSETVQKYRQRSQSARPDMVMMPEYMLQEMIDSDSIVPVEACVVASGYNRTPLVDRAVTAYTTSGVQWAMPFNVSNPVMYYNKRAFEAAGLDPGQPPVSIGQLERYARTLTESNDWPGIGIAFESGRDSGGGWFIEQWMAKAGRYFANNHNGRSAPATRVLYNNERAVELLTTVQRMVQEGIARDIGNNQTPPAGFNQLLAMADPERPTAMAIASSSALGTVKDVVDQGAIPGMTLGDLGVGPMPGPTQYRGALVGGAAMYIVADKGDETTAAAWQFMEYASTAAAQSRFAARSGYAPIREDATTIDPLASLYESDPRFRVTYEQLTAPTHGDRATDGPVLGPMLEVRGVNARMTEAILEGSDVKTQLDEAVEQANQLIRSYLASN